MALLRSTENDKHRLPRVLPGYEHINRYWDRNLNVPAAKILPGEFYVSTHGEMISTVLGSCISACIRDVRRGIGGMNHFMLPQHSEHHPGEWGGESGNSSTRYGNWAMEFLINEILKNGGNKHDLEVKIFGGGNVIESMTASNVGQKNIEFVFEYLKNERINVVSQDVGDIYPRKVLYFSDTGSVKVRKMHKTRNDVVLQREQQYMKKIDEPKLSAGDIELF